MDAKARVKLGTFLRNLITTNKDFTYLIDILNVDRYTDPVFVLDCVLEELSSDEIRDIVNVVNKSPVKEYVELLTKHESSAFD